MSEIIVLERRNKEPRGRGSSGTTAAGASDGESDVERREYVLGHHITVGPVAGPGGWMGGICSCGEHSVSRAAGAIEAWARGHRDEMSARRPVGRVVADAATR